MLPLCVKDKEFYKKFGKLPLFGGVYTTRSANEMIDEARMLMENSFHVYLETLAYGRDKNKFAEDKEKLEAVLKAFSYSTPNNMRIGVNFLFRPGLAHELSIDYNIFVINDAALGQFAHKQGTGIDISHSLFPKNIDLKYSDYFVGCSPGYLTNDLNSVGWDHATRWLSQSSGDAILVGDRPGFTIPQQIKNYRNLGIDSPFIAAQGIKVNNAREHLEVANGVLVGSGVRDENGNLSLNKINDFKSVREELIEEKKL